MSAERRTDVYPWALILMWVAAAGSLAVMLVVGASGAGRFGAARAAIHAAYVIALLWHLVRSGPSMANLPDAPLGRAARRRVGRWAAAGAAAALCLVGLFDRGLFMESLAVSALVLLVVWRRQTMARAVLLGLGASALAFVAGGLSFWRHGFVAKPMLVFMLVTVPFMFPAGGLLAARTGLGAVRVLDARDVAAGWSVLRGCLLFVPLGLLNAADGVRPEMTWVTEWWQPFVLPVWSAVAEEVVFRLMLVCFLFALLQPVLKRAPAVAAGVAVLFSAVIFGLGHGQTLGSLVGTGLGYGLPLAVVFVRRDWEHAVGAHYMINFVPWVMALLANAPS